MLLFVWMVLELIAIAGHLVINDALFPKQAIKQDIKSNVSRYIGVEPIGQAGLRWGDMTEVIHPYFGFVLDPHRNELAVSDFGFDFGKDTDPITKTQPDKIIIAVFGGSFAHGTFFSAKGLLQNCPVFTNKFTNKTTHKEVIVRNFATGGYKQPQQLMVLSYLLSLGAEFDIVINIDGFNEVALPFVENIPNQVHPSYPRMWHMRSASIIDPVIVREIGHIEFLKQNKEQWAIFFNDYGLYRSPLFALLWQIRDQSIGKEIYDIRQSIEKNSDARAVGYAVTGPEYSYPSDEALFSDLTDIWKQSSIQMKALAEANGADYYHFLQPNQYVAGSKPMSAAEKKTAIGRHPYRRGAEKGYPALIETGPELTAAGVAFTDLTSALRDHPEPLYIDSCCHLNHQGYDIIVEHICQAIQGFNALDNAQ